jgi:hypothetical protein
MPDPQLGIRVNYQRRERAQRPGRIPVQRPKLRQTAAADKQIMIQQMINPMIALLIKRVCAVKRGSVTALSGSSFRLSMSPAVRCPAAPYLYLAGAHEKNARQCNSRRRVASRFG